MAAKSTCAQAKTVLNLAKSLNSQHSAKLVAPTTSYITSAASDRKKPKSTSSNTSYPKCPFSSVTTPKQETWFSYMLRFFQKYPAAPIENETSDLCPSVHVAEWVNAKPFDNIPAPPQLPYIGHMWKVLPLVGDMNTKRIHWHHEEFRKLYGPITKLNFPQKDVVFLYNPEDTQRMYRAAGEHPNRSGLFRALHHYRKHTRKEQYDSLGLILSQGEEWYQLRSKVQQAMMRPQSATRYQEPLEDIANDFIDVIYRTKDSEGNVPETFVNELYKWTLESVAFVALNTRLGCLSPNLSPDSEPQQMIDAVASTFQAMNKTEMGVPMWKLLSTPAWRKLVKAQDYFQQIAVKYIQEEMDKMDMDDDEASLLELFLKKGLKAEHAAIVAVDLLIAGIDTTSHAVGFTLYELAKNPRAQEALHEEIQRVIPDRDARITPTHINKMPYLKAVIKESLRLRHPFYATFRVMEKDTVMSGYKIPKGTFCASMGQTICRQAEYYENPNEFLPERWLERKSKPHAFTFIPFGHGPRMCVGRRFAELEMQLMLSKICQRFQIEYHHEDLDMYTLLISYPDLPLLLQFKDR